MKKAAKQEQRKHPTITLASVCLYGACLNYCLLQKIPRFIQVSRGIWIKQIDSYKQWQQNQ